MSYAFTHDGQTYTPDGRATIADPDTHNAALNAADLARWGTAPCVARRAQRALVPDGPLT